MSTLTASPLPSHITNPAITTPSSSRTRSTANDSPLQPTHSSPRSNSSKDGAMSVTDIESVLRSHGGDARKALEALLVDRASLQSQNSQLWKLIEKQRSQCASLVADNERLRGDRERANGKLLSAGMDPIGGKKMSTSSSAVGLGVKADPPPMRRQNSDQEGRSSRKETDRTARSEKVEKLVASDKPNRPSLTVPSPNASSQGSTAGDRSASPSDKVYTSPLLPSPLNIQETKLRPQSRMVFPSEVTSWLSLADSPKNRSNDIRSQPTPPSQLSTSSGNPFLNSPPIEIQHATDTASLHVLASLSQTISEEQLLKDEAPSTIQAVPPRKSSMRSPTESEFPQSSTSMHGSSLPQVPTPTIQTSGQPGTPTLQEKPFSPPTDIEQSRPSSEAEVKREFEDAEPTSEPARVGSAVPTPSSTKGLPRISPSLLPHARLTIPTSTVSSNSHGRDVLCFIVSIVVRPPNAQPISWNVSKLFSAFIDLDTKIKARSGKARKEWKTMIAPLPDGKAWKDFAPSKIDQRKAALEAYLQSLLVAPIADKTDLCDFLCTDHVRTQTNLARKEGYLTKKGKNFGGWKTRYFVLAGPVMEYYDSRGGPHLGSIVITNAQIGRQNRPNESTDDRDFRHAFLIIEQSRRGTSNRHVLCAESDAERDNWIELLVRFVDPDTANGQPLSPVQSITQPPPPPYSTNGALSRKRSNSRKSSKDVVITAAAPMASLNTGGSKFGGVPSPSLFNSMEHQRAAAASPDSMLPDPTLTQSRSNGDSSRDIPIRNHLAVSQSTSSDMLSTSPSSQSSLEPTPRNVKRQSVMPSRSGPPPAHSAAYLTKVATEGLQAPPGLSDRDRERKAKSGRFWPSFGRTADKVHRPVFGVPLVDSIQIASKANLPAIVYRCIEYLEAKKAETEEGIYRLSGSSAMIKGLKDRFDAEGDVNLVQVDERWDPHAIAGLLKAFLRELPTSLLTVDLHPRFLAVMDLIDSSARVAELAKLVSELPPPNYALLRALTAHLILIVRNSSINKMTLRNIGIVFSPTLGIPAGIFSELVTHFGAIFDDEVEANEEVVELGSIAESAEDAEDTITRRRNSLLYQAGGADALLGLGGRSLDPSMEDSISEVSTDLEVDSETLSNHSQESLATSLTTPRAESYPSPPTIKKAKAASRAAEVGLVIESSIESFELGRKPDEDARNGLLPNPRPPGIAGLAPALIPSPNGATKV